MDGSKRYPLVSDSTIRSPTGLTIDYQNNHRIYWVDTKLSKIESMNRNGGNRITIAQSESLHHPISLDVFESSMYWVTRESGELLKQDKFGRGIAVPIMKELVNPKNIKGNACKCI